MASHGFEEWLRNKGLSERHSERHTNGTSGAINGATNGAAHVSDPQAYALGAYLRELDILRNTLEGNRNTQLNTSAFKLAEFINSGLLPQATVEDGLRQVALDIGLDPREINNTLRSGLSNAAARALHIETPFPIPEITVLDSVPALDSITSLYAPLDWQQLYDDTATEVHWLIEDILERGRLHALYAPSKSYKSLFTQFLVGTLVRDHAATVIYVDMENSRKDIRVRFGNMGFTPTDLNELLYYSFPSLPALDTSTGGTHLAALCALHKPDLVVIDTTSRVVRDSENEADTFRALYRYSFMPLKHMEIAALRIDHAGKDPRMGQRGSSAKADDVDTLWHLEKHDFNRFVLTCERQRTGNHPERLDFILEEKTDTEPLRFVPLGESVSVLEMSKEDKKELEINRIIKVLDDAGLPDNASHRNTKAVKPGGRSEDIEEATRRRQARSGSVPKSVPKDQLEIEP